MSAPIISRRAVDLTNVVFARAATGDFHAAVTRVDEVLAEVRAEAYEAGLAAGRREHEPGCCGGAGMPCPDCNEPEPGRLPMAEPGVRLTPNLLTGGWL